MQVAASTPLQSIFGYGSSGRAGPVASVTPAQAAGSGSSWSLEDQAFGAAVIREARRGTQDGEDSLQYGADAKLKQFGPGSPKSESEMSSEDKELLDKLRARDSLVRGHETAHILAAGGQAAGPAQYTYQTGPDGRQYAIGGSVSISIVSSPVSDEDAANQAETARRAATANGEMSLRDMQVAMRATELSGRARSRAMDSYAAQA